MDVAAVAEPLDLLTTRQAGERLGLAGAYVSQLVNAGKLLPFAFAGAQRNALFRAGDVDLFARERAEANAQRLEAAKQQAAARLAAGRAGAA
jgi:hypothetical protein